MNEFLKLSDPELVERLEAGEHGAFKEIYERYKGLLYRHAMKMIASKEEVNDLIHELFLTLWANRANLVIKVSLSAYLYSATRNRVLDYIAKNKFARDYINSLQLYIEKAVPYAEQEVLLRDLQKIIESKVALLPLKMREVFNMSRQQQLSHKEIAEKLSLSEKTVKKQIGNALKILKPKIHRSFLLLL